MTCRDSTSSRVSCQGVPGKAELCEWQSFQQSKPFLPEEMCYKQEESCPEKVPSNEVAQRRSFQAGLPSSMLSGGHNQGALLTSLFHFLFFCQIKDQGHQPALFIPWEKQGLCNPPRAGGILRGGCQGWEWCRLMDSGDAQRGSGLPLDAVPVTASPCLTSLQTVSPQGCWQLSDPLHQDLLPHRPQSRPGTSASR